MSTNLKVPVTEYMGVRKSRSLPISPNSSTVWENLKQTAHAGSLDDVSIICETCNSFGHLIH